MFAKANLIERGLAAAGFAEYAAKNLRARAFVNFGGQFSGARSDKTSMRTFNPSPGSADSDAIGDLETLRARSRDLSRNAPIARGARNTSRTNVVATGLRMRSVLQREILGLSEEEAETWEDYAEVLFDLWASSTMSDVARKSNFYEQQAIAYTSAWDSGDCFALRRYKEGTSFLALCVQLIEADRVSTPHGKSDRADIRDGVELDRDGEPIAYHLLNKHPGDAALLKNYVPEDWVRIPARGQSGDPLMIHLLEMDRIGLSRGIPALAPVIESLKQLDRYAEAELMAAVVSAFFTVFIKTTGGDGEDSVGIPGVPGVGQSELALGNGTVAELAPGEDVTIANPSRPNPNFDPFTLAVIRQIGMALGIPYEVLIMHFSSSYTASKAALETARQFFEERRTWLARKFCQPVYEWFLRECVARDIIAAPGFLDDPIKRMAWCGSTWIGSAPIVLDSVKDATAAEKWMNLGVRTGEEVTIATTGGDFFRNQEIRQRESKMREGIKPAVPETEKPAGERTRAA